MNKDVAKKIEAILFVTGEPLSLIKLSKILNLERESVKKSLDELENDLFDRGIRLSQNNEEYMLVTAPEFSKFVEDYLKEDLDEDLSKAALETLSVVVYRGPLSRSGIDYIRGVNSAFTVRNLMVRGLIERKADPDDSRSWLYSPSFQFLKYMGISKIEDLPGYEEFKKEADHLLENKDAVEPQ